MILPTCCPNCHGYMRSWLYQKTYHNQSFIYWHCYWILIQVIFLHCYFAKTRNREVGSSVKKLVSSGSPGPKTPDVSAPVAWESNTTTKNPAEQQARERLSKPPPDLSSLGGSQGNNRKASESQQDRKSSFLNFSKELFLSEGFGVPLESYRAIARGLFGEGVGIENLTQEQKEKIFIGLKLGQ